MENNDNKSIYRLYESLNQHGIAFDQQRNKSSTKYTPQQGKYSYNKGQRPTIDSEKMGAAPFIATGGVIDEEEDVELHVKGYGMLSPSQVRKSIFDTSERLYNHIKNGNLTTPGLAMLLAELMKAYADYEQGND